MEMRDLHVDLLWNMTAELNVLHPDNWTDTAIQILDNLRNAVDTNSQLTIRRSKVKFNGPTWPFRY